ncbi:MAG: tRNA glutamyl-Q(34) synthetase GluQRS [Betaproteobacteria bacterium]|nr:MAG: tRNA glutamyl-Q(34) synthetase GluQRS [Betaproteobacteria bacterium]
MYAGRFAPSPTGPLHFGSLVAALASWLDARAAGGRWQVRIEDLDPPREQPGAAGQILRALESLGLEWDGPVAYQSRRRMLYRDALERLAGKTYACGCSRKEVADSALATNSAGVYPGTCRNGLPAGKTPRALRMRTTAEPICFVDRVQGKIEQSVERDVGDFIVCRADGQFAYQLAVVVDDAEQGITDVVRGADLLDSTARQIYLQRLLGYPTPRYLHVPVAVNAVGEKLSKQTGAPAIGLTSARDQLRRALAFLGQPEAANLREAVRSWDPGLIPARRMVTAPDALE